jgi:hypothetical protein
MTQSSVVIIGAAAARLERPAQYIPVENGCTIGITGDLA